MIRHRHPWLACLAVALLSVAGVPSGCRAQASPQVMDELTVTGERSGPGLWHVRRGDAHVWILGSLSPLPKGITWRSKQFEQLLDRTHSVLIPKPFEIGIVRVLWLLVTERSLLMVHGGKNLRDVMPPALHARFAAQRAKYTTNSDKWERYRPIIAAAFLQQAAFHATGLSTRLDLGAAVRVLAAKHRVPIDEVKAAGVGDALEALKTMPPASENACVEASLATVERDLPRLVQRAQAWAAGNVERLANLREPPEVDACRAALDEAAGVSSLIASVRRTWMSAITEHLRGAETTAAVINMDLLLEKGGLLDELRAQGYEIQGP
ncbi:MAG: TraB/GumN family protein [Steroidobacteraceae bacterium]